MQALRKPLRTDVGITAPRLCVEAIMPSLVLCMKFLRLRIYKKMGIKPLFFYYVSDGISPNPTAKLRNFGDNQ